VTDLANPQTVVAELLRRYRSHSVCVADLMCDTHAGQARPAAIVETDGQAVSLTYAELRDQSARLAGALSQLGVGPGDPVGVLLSKSAELLVTLLAIFRLGAVHLPLFTALGSDALAYRLDLCDARVVVAGSHRGRLAGPSDRSVICAGPARQPGDLDFYELVRSGPSAEAVRRSGDDPLILLFTSGTTGKPKGVQIPVWALASFHSYMLFGLGLRDDDVFLNISDPGWGYGLFYGLIGPLLCGHTTIVRNAMFDPLDLLEAVRRYQVTNLCGPPTAFRALRGATAGLDAITGHRLQRISSAGEPLTAEIAQWATARLGVPIFDHYGQSELGMVIGYPHLHTPRDAQVTEAIMGPSLPGFRAVILDEAGADRKDEAPGDLALDTAASPLFWFHGYLHDPAATAQRYPFGSRYYVTADRASVGPDGEFRSATRADDVITSSGYRIGPFDVETVVADDRDVAQAAVIGIADELRGEAVSAVVVLCPGARPSAELSNRLGAAVRSRVGKQATLRHVFYVDGLPETASGKIQRSQLRDMLNRPDQQLGIDIPPI
jgi:acetyl-CoA synthetase